MEDKQICVVHLEACEACLNLRSHRLVQMVDLVDYKYAIALPLDRLSYDLLTVPSLITRRGVNEIQARVDGTPDRCDQLRQGQLAVGQIANPKHSGHKTSAPQHTAGMEENIAHGCSLLQSI